MQIKRKGYKKAKRRLLFLIVVLVVLLVFVMGSISREWLKIIDNRREVLTLTVKYNDLCKEAEQLTSDVNKLQDPDYIARYAREKYAYTKDGELIIRIPKSSTSE